MKRSKIRRRYGRAIDRKRSQDQMFKHAEQRSFDRNKVMMDLLFGSNPISDDELRKLIAKRPEVYGPYAVYLGKR